MKYKDKKMVNFRASMLEQLLLDTQVERRKKELGTRSVTHSRVLHELIETIEPPGPEYPALWRAYRNLTGVNGKVRIMNSAVMHGPGIFAREDITREEFVEAVVEAFDEGRAISSLSYEQNRNLLKEWTGIDFPLSFEKTVVEDGDTLLCMFLPYREGGLKGRKIKVDDFAYARIEYSKNKP